MLSKLSYIYILIIPLLAVGINLGYSSVVICFFFLLLKLLLTNRDTIVVYLLMFGGPVVGVFRAVYPSVPIYGIFVTLIALFMSIKYLSSLLKQNITSLLYLLIVYLIFFLSYLYAIPSEFATNKILNLFSNGFFALIAYYIFFQSQKISIEDLVQLVLITGIYYFVANIDLQNLFPGNIFDYSWYRIQSSFLKFEFGESAILNYQQIGTCLLFGYSCFLSSFKINKLKFVFYTVISFHLIMVTGSRQSILGFMVVLFLRIAYFPGKLSIKQIIPILIGLLSVYLIYQIVSVSESDSVTRFLENGDIRSVIYLDTIRLISEYPLLGIGFGSYPFYSSMGMHWPHNFVLEIINEIGFIGSSLLLLILVIYFKTNRLSFRLSAQSEFYYFLPFVVYLVRYMISSDLSSSIELFSVIFAVTSVRFLNKRQTKSIDIYGT